MNKRKQGENAGAAFAQEGGREFSRRVLVVCTRDGKLEVCKGRSHTVHASCPHGRGGTSILGQCEGQSGYDMCPPSCHLLESRAEYIRCCCKRLQ